MQGRRLAFPLRPLAIYDQVKIGAGGNTSYHSWTEEDLLGPIDVPSRDIRADRDSAGTDTRDCRSSNRSEEDFDWDPAVDRLLKEDEKTSSEAINRSLAIAKLGCGQHHGWKL